MGAKGMTGTEFLMEAMKVFPEAKKALLTAYADTEAAITSINSIGLDYYLQKPWAPPEQNLYPILDDLLSDWAANAVMPFEGIRIVGTLWSPGSHSVKDFLARNHIPYQWFDLDRDPEANVLIEGLKISGSQLPVAESGYPPWGIRLPVIRLQGALTPIGNFHLPRFHYSAAPELRQANR